MRLNDSLGSEQYQSTNSSIACLYPRCDSGLLRLFRTAVLACSRSGSRKTLFGRTVRRFRFGFFMVGGLHRHQAMMGVKGYRVTGALHWFRLYPCPEMSVLPTIRELRQRALACRRNPLV